jgi:hypothetical protein
MPACRVRDSQVGDSTFSTSETAIPCLFEALCLVAEPIRAPVVGLPTATRPLQLFPCPQDFPQYVWYVCWPFLGLLQAA